MSDDLDARWRLRVFRRECMRRRAQLHRVRHSAMFAMLIEGFGHKTSFAGRERALNRLVQLLRGMVVPVGARLDGAQAVGFVYSFATLGSPIIDGAGCGIRVKALSLRNGQEFDLVDVPDADLVGALDPAAVLLDRASDHLRRSAERQEGASA